MAGFWDEILSGRWPKSRELIEREFNRIVTEVFGGVSDAEAQGQQADLERLEALLKEEKARHEQCQRELAALRYEKRALTYKLDAARKALEGHGEPLG